MKGEEKTKVRGEEKKRTGVRNRREERYENRKGGEKIQHEKRRERRGGTAKEGERGREKEYKREKRKRVFQ